MDDRPLTYAEMLHLIAYIRRMMAQLETFLDETEKKIPAEIECRRDNTGAWPS
jgi:hypothetical protein